MNKESDTPRTDALMPDQGHKRTIYEHIQVMETHARKLERELNGAMAALRNLTHEIGKHEGASMMHPRLTRAIAAANRLTNEKKEQEKSIDT
jgi:hypothetical protein